MASRQMDANNLPEWSETTAQTSKLSNKKQELTQLGPLYGTQGQAF